MTTKTIAQRLADAVELLRAFQSTFGSLRPDEDDEDDRETWDRIDTACSDLTALAQSGGEGEGQQVHLSDGGSAVEVLGKLPSANPAELRQAADTLCNNRRWATAVVFRQCADRIEALEQRLPDPAQPLRAPDTAPKGDTGKNPYGPDICPFTGRKFW